MTMADINFIRRHVIPGEPTEIMDAGICPHCGSRIKLRDIPLKPRGRQRISYCPTFAGHCYDWPTGLRPVFDCPHCGMHLAVGEQDIEEPCPECGQERIRRAQMLFPTLPEGAARIVMQHFGIRPDGRRSLLEGAA